MTETISIRLQTATKARLDALAKSANRSKSYLAAEAITAYIESEEWQIGEIKAALSELDNDQIVSHEDVTEWLNSWGQADEKKAPR